MKPFTVLTWHAAVAGRWIARIIGTLMVLFVLGFMVGEGPPPVWRMTAREQLYALGMSGLFLGLILAWFREGAGGLLSMLGWGFLAVLAKRPPWDWPLLIPGGVGLLHLLCWWRLRGPAPDLEPLTADARARLKKFQIFVWVSLSVFVLLCANEMFGQPPLMTRPGPPPAAMAGTWSTIVKEVRVVFTIATDGSVSGTIGGAEVIGGRLISNRSWFGRLINWRTDYAIRGTLSRVVEAPDGIAGDRFSALVNVKGSELDGSLLLTHPGPPRQLRLNLRKR